MNSRHSSFSGRSLRGRGARACCVLLFLLPGLAFPAADLPDSAAEARIFTPPGFEEPGKPARITGESGATIGITVRDSGTGKATPCRINVVGPDGNYYQPEPNDLSPVSLTGVWPTARGNRLGKAPFRYFGRFFYSRGRTKVQVPPGPVRIEVWKGFEYRPEVRNLRLPEGASQRVEIDLRRTLPMQPLDYYGGDTHLHFERRTPEDDEFILDLMEAEDVHYGGILSYNENVRQYTGTPEAQGYPQLRGLGTASIAARGPCRIISGQEYRSAQYGHTKVFLSDTVVQPNVVFDPNTWPLFGEAIRGIREGGGLAFWAHGGYQKEIYADYLLGAVDGVELLQFGIYRPIGLEGWYHILNLGFQFPILGASDYGACRKLADCRTYVHAEAPPAIDDWLRACAEGRSFVTTGPMLLLEVDGHAPGATLRIQAGKKQTANVSIRARCEVTPITHVDLIANGVVIHRFEVPRGLGQAHWLEVNREIEIGSPTWIAARAWSRSPEGLPDAEAHTNPVYIHLGDQPPYHPDSAQWLLRKLEGRLEIHRKRNDFPGQEKVLAYFEKARRRLLEIIADRGLKPSPGK